jgi:predicted dehydrogenase
MTMAATEDVRIGVLGLGAISQVVHLPVLTGMSGATIVAVCDADDQKAKALAARFGVSRVYRRDEEVFAADDLDAIVICTPNHLHEEQAIAGLESGKHVLVEKPLALSAEGAARAVAAAERSGKALVVAMNNRYRPDTQALKPFVSGGELGEVFLTRGAWLNRKIRVLRPTWRHRLATAGGGALMDLGVQTLDLCLWILGYPRVDSVFCHTHRGEGMEVEDSAAIVLGMASGSAITLTVSWNLVAERDRQYMRFLATRGSAAIAPLAVFKEVEHGLLDVTPNLQPGRENVYTASYRQELTHFVEACLGKPAEPPREQVELMEIVALAYQSAREKRKVEAGS